MLKIHLAKAGHNSTIELNGQDISRFLTSVTVSTAVGEVTTATLEYSGAVIAEGDASVVLRQAAHFLQCEDCCKTLKGQPQDPVVVETTAFQATNKTYERPDFPHLSHTTQRGQ